MYKNQELIEIYIGGGRGLKWVWPLWYLRTLKLAVSQQVS